VASYSAIDIEKIVSLGSDLVLAGGSGFNPPDQLAKLRTLGIPVLVVYAKDVAGVLRDIELVGAAIGGEQTGKELATSMREQIDAIAKAVTPGGAAPRVFYEIDATGAIYGPAPDSFVAEMVKLAGGDPITSGTPGAFEISIEKLVDADPEVIVLGDSAYGVTAETVKQRPGWSVITAVKSGEIRPINDIEVTRPGPRLVTGLRNLALAINPKASLPPAP
jgi:iron complex transport system substrate-binding protein